MKKATSVLLVASAISMAPALAGCTTSANRVALIAANDNGAPEPPKTPTPVAANNNYNIVDFAPSPRAAKYTPDALKKVLIPGKNASHVTGLEPAFASSLVQMFDAMPDHIRKKVKILSGYRSPEHQKVLWDKALKKYGSAKAARKWVAPAGKSNHQRGIAVDLEYSNSSEARAWVHENAGRYGLYFPMSWEPWHIEPVGSR